jgi:L-lactate dehydrogenase complex protein LldG
MSSRESILQKVKAAQPSLLPLPEIGHQERNVDAVKSFKTVLESIGGKVVFLKEDENIAEKIVSLFPEAKRIVSSITSVEQYFLAEYKNLLHHSLQDVDVSIIEAQFGVAENGAVWVTEDDLKIRVLPFICEHLVAVVDAKSLVPTMHEAYARIGSMDYGFGGFIAGPSKTADIEQSLVLGAHGPKTMTVLIRGYSAAH